MFKRTTVAGLTAALGFSLIAGGTLQEFGSQAQDPQTVPGLGYAARVTGEYHPADLDRNGLVDMYDVFVLMEQWGTCERCAADLTRDGFVDHEDLYIVLRFIGVDSYVQSGGEIGGQKPPKGKVDRRTGQGSSFGG